MAETKIPVRVLFPKDEQMPAVFSNHMTVQFFGDVYVVTFYAAFPPMLSGDEIVQLKDELVAPARSVARLAIPADRMPDFVKAMTQNLEHSRSAAAPHRSPYEPGEEE